MDAGRDLVQEQLGEISAPAVCWGVKWPLPESIYYRIFFNARNGGWHQDLIMKRSKRGYWAAATRVKNKKGREVVFEHMIIPTSLTSLANRLGGHSGQRPPA